MKRISNLAVGLFALLVIAVSIFNLESARSGVTLTEIRIGTTPATLYRTAGGDKPLVIIAHGFAGSRQMMQAYSLTLAKAGNAVLAFDTEGHGRNPIPMSGDVTKIDGTTALLVAETRRVIAAGRDLPGGDGRVALLGHSMATDVIIRAAIAEREAGTPVDAIVAISMFSGAVTATQPERLLIISGEWEAALRDVALDALQQVQPEANEGGTVSNNKVIRRAVVAPSVEHVGVLYSATALRESRDWLADEFSKKNYGPVAQIGPWILLLMAGIVALLRPVVGTLPKQPTTPFAMSPRSFWMATFIPAIAVPLICTALYTPFMPVLVADYLVIHLALYAVLQLAILRVWRSGWPGLSVIAVLLLVIWGCAVFGFAMDRYVSSFIPSPERITIIALLALGTVPFMIADSYATGAGSGKWWHRIVARVALLASLGVAAVIDPERLMFIFIILPVLLLFFLVHGLMGRWVGQRSGPATAGIGLGLCLAWALGVTFPLFSAG